MANRVFDNVIIVDSAMGNLNAVGGTSSNITNFNIQAVSFWASSTLGNFILTGADTGLDHIVHISYINAGSGIVSAWKTQEFPKGLIVSTLKVPTLTAGTGWVYLA